MTIERPFKTTYDWEYMEKVIRRQVKGGPVPIFEIVVDAEPMSEVTGIEYPAALAVEIFTNTAETAGDDSLFEMAIRLMDLDIAFHKAVGYDYCFMTPVIPMKKSAKGILDDPDARRGRRAWQNETGGIITSREDFNKYVWPSLEEINLLPVDYAAGKVPPGMKVTVLVNGIFETLSMLMGLQQLAIKSIDEPELVEDILDQVTRFMVYTVDIVAAHPAVGAVIWGEDMGDSKGTLLSPRFFRKHIIPRQKLAAEACHRHGKLFILHSCGQISAIMDDLIDVVGIDAKHSFEDKIQPVEQWYDRYHDRIAILGGVDMGLLAQGTAEEVRSRTRQILEHCAPGGGYCMGTGNSLANFVKIENYYAMLDETRKWNEHHGH
jgi:uroporphyrinogen decarboxylase